MVGCQLEESPGFCSIHYSSLRHPKEMGGWGSERGMAQCCHLVVGVVTVRVQLSGPCVFQGGWKLSRPKTGARETEKRREEKSTTRDCDQQRLTQLD